MTKTLYSNTWEKQVEKMELFPGASSVACIDGLIVAKFENEFEL